MFIATLVALVTFLLCISIHYEVFRSASKLLSTNVVAPRKNILLLMSAVLLAHTIEIWTYAAVFYALEGQLGLGHIAGDFSGSFFDYVYFSAVSYTSLGLGDVWPHGPLRLLTGIEGLNGLILIGWSVAFTYPVVKRVCPV